MIIDEVGKMELHSPKFEMEVMKLFSSKTTILGTLPVSKGKPLQPVEFIKAHASVKLLNVCHITCYLKKTLFSVFQSFDAILF